ncbi:ATP-dependent zinc metalloprotease FtsH [Calorimonas adulescens]|uniref:ATP-dependent zinc metalloprotease FtsH n=1 Tax=Calorimonas adulescens TaxID=2606906 RepID=A0A5D8QBL9_9THEO|nr:ATP-dependent zinc metalloprotease FtsH [Calorimonas adulescens]
MIWVLILLVVFAISFFYLMFYDDRELSPVTVPGTKGKEKEQNRPSTTFKDVAGLDEVIEELQDIVDYMNNTQKYRAMGAKFPKGIIFYGPPGTGKTLLASAMAGETRAAFYPVSGSEFVEKYVGVGASRIRALFQKARKTAPSVIFIDEIDAVGSRRNVDNNSEKDQTLNQLLVEMDGFNSNDEAVIVIGATNRLDLLDEALLRPGRFDRHIFIGHPNLRAREEILRVHTKNKPLEPDVDLKELAMKTFGMTGAHLASIANEAAILAVRRGKKRIGCDEFNEAIERVIAGIEKKNAYVIEKEKLIVAYHEAGHALISNLLKVNTISKISIVPRGHALGYVLNLPNEDNFLETKTQLLNRMCVLLGGRAAEELIFKDVSSGAQNDLKEVTQIALTMITSYGMSDIGKRVYDGQNTRYSEEIDREVNKIIDMCYKETLAILEKNKNLLDKIVNKLLEANSLNGYEIDEIIKSSKSSRMVTA